MSNRAVLGSTQDRIIQLRLKMAFLRLRLAVKAGFDPGQLRDEQGRWTDAGGGQVVVTRNFRTGNNRIDSKTDTLIDVAKEVSGKLDPGMVLRMGLWSTKICV